MLSKKTEKLLSTFANLKENPVPQIIIDKAKEFINSFKKIPSVSISCSYYGDELYLLYAINKKENKTCVVIFNKTDEIRLEQWIKSDYITTKGDLLKILSNCEDSWFENKFKLTYEVMVRLMRLDCEEKPLEDVKSVPSKLKTILESYIGKTITEENIEQLFDDIRDNLPELELNCSCNLCGEDLKSDVLRSFDEETIVNPNREQYSIYVQKCNCRKRRNSINEEEKEKVE